MIVVFAPEEEVESIGLHLFFCSRPDALAASGSLVPRVAIKGRREYAAPCPVPTAAGAQKGTLALR